MEVEEESAGRERGGEGGGGGGVRGEEEGRRGWRRRRRPRVLWGEMEEERLAAASAASKAMAMMRRLQKEKAEVQMELRQFRRFAAEIDHLRALHRPPRAPLSRFRYRLHAYRILFLPSAFTSSSTCSPCRHGVRMMKMESCRGPEQQYPCKNLAHGGADMIEKQNSEYKAKLCGGSDGELGAAMWQAALQQHGWRARSTMVGRPTDLRQRGRRARRSTVARPAVLRRFGGRTYCTGLRVHSDSCVGPVATDAFNTFRKHVSRALYVDLEPLVYMAGPAKKAVPAKKKRSPSRSQIEHV